MTLLTAMMAAGVALAPLAVTAEEGSKPAPAAGEPGERTVCKRVSTIGSLVKKRRVCMTAREWKDMAARSQDLTAEMQKPSGAPR